MDEFKLRELKDLRDTIIKRHIILMILSFLISIAVTISFFILKKHLFANLENGITLLKKIQYNDILLKL